jgi:hypothetical protein
MKRLREVLARFIAGVVEVFTTSRTKWVNEKLTQLAENQQETIHAQAKKIVDLERAYGIQQEKIFGLRDTLKQTNTENDRLRDELDAVENARLLAEGRVADLQSSLDLERQRFDSAIAHDREITAGMRARFGLIPKPEGQAAPGQERPIQSGRPGWRGTATQLERESKKIADRNAEHWQAKIKAVEERDAKLNSDKVPDANNRTDAVENETAGATGN